MSSYTLTAKPEHKTLGEMEATFRHRDRTHTEKKNEQWSTEDWSSDRILVKGCYKGFDMEESYSRTGAYMKADGNLYENERISIDGELGGKLKYGEWMKTSIGFKAAT